MARRQSTESCDQGTVLQAGKGFDSTAAIQFTLTLISQTCCTLYWTGCFVTNVHFGYKV